MFTLLVEQHLFQKTVEYVDGTVDLQELEAWLLPNLGTILDAGGEASIALAKLIEGGAIEFQVGISSEETLVQELKKLLSSATSNQNIKWASNTAESKEIWDMEAAESKEIWDMEVLNQPQTLNWELQFT